MKAITSVFKGLNMETGLITHEQVELILNKAETDKRAALGLIGEFVGAGHLVVQRGLYKKALISETDKKPMSRITARDIQTEFSAGTYFFERGKILELAAFFGNGQTEEESISTYLECFTSLELPTDICDDNGPLFIYGRGMHKRGFQLERR